jgi:hypothetical protein
MLSIFIYYCTGIKSWRRSDDLTVAGFETAEFNMHDFHFSVDGLLTMIGMGVVNFWMSLV